MSIFRLGALACLLSAAATAAMVQIEQKQGRADVTVDGKPFTTYYFGPAAAKPYLMPLRTAAGVILSRSFPVGNDASAGKPGSSAFEPHQRPLYFGHGDIDGLDFWTEKVFARYYGHSASKAWGHAVLERVEDVSSGSDAGHIRARFLLEDPDNRVVAEETQSFTFRGGERTRIIDCEFVIEATHGPVVFGDTKEGTFGIRLRKELSAPNDHMLNSHGAVGERNIWGKPADWVAYSGAIGSKKVSIVAFDHPSSFHHPTTWHARAYGLLAANPFAAREFTGDPSKDGSWTVPEKKSIRFRYEVLLYDGELSPAEIEQAYRKYASQN